MTVEGRRDRKKSETRQALRDAAHRLFAEKGFTQTTIDDIAEAADVSRRTFFRYYDSKDDLLRSDVSDLLPVMLAALRARPAAEPPFTALLAALRTLIGPDGPPAIAQTLADPAISGLRARLSLIRMLGEWEQGITDALLTRAGLDPSGFAPSGFAPSGFAPSGLDPSGLDPSGLDPSGLVDTDASGTCAPTEEDRLRAVVTACAATSALRAAAQVYRARYPGRGLETTRLLPIVEQAFAVLQGTTPPTAP